MNDFTACTLRALIIGLLPDCLVFQVLEMGVYSTIGELIYTCKMIQPGIFSRFDQPVHFSIDSNWVLGYSILDSKWKKFDFQIVFYYFYWHPYRLFFLYTNLHELFFQFISWTNWVNSGKFMDNCWISCLVMADIKKSLRRSHNY